MIGGVRVKNWRSHAESEFQFEAGTNVLVGISGSGKSSVMDAISFGLFGTFPALKARKVKLEELIRDGQEEAEVEVGFLDGYSVRRVLEKGKGTKTAELRKDGKLIEGIKAEPVTKKVEEVLKLDYELFERAIYSEQNQLDYFLKIPRGQRKGKIDQLLRIDQFELARKSCNKLISSIGSEAEGIERALKDFENVGIKEREELEKRVAEAEELSKKRKVDFEEIELEKREIGKRVKEGQEKSDKFIRIGSEIKGLEKRQKELGLLAKKKPEKSSVELEKELASAQEEIKKRDQLLGGYRAGLKEGKEKIAEKAELEEMLAAFGERDVVKEYDEAAKGLKRKGEELAKAGARKEFLEKSVSEVGGEECPMCGRGWDEHLRGEVKIEREAELEKVGVTVGMVEGEVEGLEKKVAALQKEAEAFGKGHERLKEIGEPAKAVEKIEIAARGLEEKNESGEKRIGEIRKGLEILKAVEECEEVEKEIVEKRKGLEKLKFDAAEFGKLKRDYDSIIGKWNKANGELASSWTARDNLKAELKRVLEREKEVGALGGKLENMKKGEEFLVKFKNALLDVQEDLRLEFVKGLNESMSELWEAVYPYSDFTDVRLGIVDGDYVLQLKKSTWVDVEGIVSGGERSTAALVLRVGFALALAPHLKILILDEPTHNLDERGIVELGKVLRDRIGEYVSQVFLITHEERLEQAVSGSLYRLERDKGRKEASKVILVEAL